MAPEFILYSLIHTWSLTKFVSHHVSKLSSVFLCGVLIGKKFTVLTTITVMKDSHEWKAC